MAKNKAEDQISKNTSENKKIKIDVGLSDFPDRPKSIAAQFLPQFDQLSVGMVDRKFNQIVGTIFKDFGELPVIDDQQARAEFIESISRFPSLQHLKLPEWITDVELGRIARAPNFQQLQTLDLSDCATIEYPPPLPKHLQELNVFGCAQLRQLPQLLPPSLKVVKAGGVENDDELQKILALPNLEKVYLPNSLLINIPDKLSPSLKVINLSGCEGLYHFPFLITQYIG